MQEIMNYIRRHKDLLAILLVAAVIFLTYMRTLGYPVLDNWDDQEYILFNKFLGLTISNFVKYLTEPYYCMYYPVTMYSYMLDHALWGINGFGYHLQNILWHVVASVAVYKTFRLLKIKYSVSVVITLLFALHPQRVESVVWLSERKDVLCNAFYLWSVFFYIRFRECGRNELAPFIFFVLAMLSKPMSISLPFVLICYELFKQRRFNLVDAIKKIWPYLATGAMFLAIIYMNQAVNNDQFVLADRLYYVIYNIAWYIWKTLVPVWLCPIYSIEPVINTLPGVILTYAAIFACGLYLLIHYSTVFKRICIPVAAGYLVTLGPVSGFIPFGAFIHADRWSYIPSLFIWLSIGIFISSVLRKHRRLLVPAVLCMIACICIFIPMNLFCQGFWKTSFNVFESSGRFPVSNRLAIWSYGNYLIDKNRYEKLPEIIEKLSLYENPTQRDILRMKYFFAAYLYRTNAPEKAIPIFLEIKKKHLAENLFYDKYEYAKAISMLGNSYFMTGNTDRAKACYENLLLYYKGSDFDTNYYKGMAAMASKNYSEAVSWFKKAKKIYADNQVLNNNLETAEKLLNR